MVLYHFANTGVSVTNGFILSFFMRSNVTFTTKQDSRVCCLAQTGFVAFGTDCGPSQGPPLLTLKNTVYVLLEISVSFKTQRYTYFASYKPLCWAPFLETSLSA